MRRVLWLSAVAGIAAAWVAAQAVVPVRDLRKHLGELVTVRAEPTGIALEAKHEDALSVPVCEFRDDNGDVVYVRPRAEAPVAGQEYLITGTPTLDQTTGQLYLDEQSRLAAPVLEGTAPPQAPPPPSGPATGLGASPRPVESAPPLPPPPTPVEGVDYDDWGPGTDETPSLGAVLVEVALLVAVFGAGAGAVTLLLRRRASKRAQ